MTKILSKFGEQQLAIANYGELRVVLTNRKQGNILNE